MAGIFSLITKALHAAISDKYESSPRYHSMYQLAAYKAGGLDYGALCDKYKVRWGSKVLRSKLSYEEQQQLARGEVIILKQLDGICKLVGGDLYCDLQAVEDVLKDNPTLFD